MPRLSHNMEGGPQLRNSVKSPMPPSDLSICCVQQSPSQALAAASQCHSKEERGLRFAEDVSGPSIFSAFLVS